MRKYLIPLLLILCGCTERIDLQSRSDFHDYLAVEATLTDRSEDPQQVILSRTISYFHTEAQPMVRGASVKVNDVTFSEKEPGIYTAPEGYACEMGVEYKLRIRLPEGDTYEAEASMPEAGFRMDAIDYAWAGGKTMDMDSLWTVGVWGTEKDIDSYYLLTHAVNGVYQPKEMCKLAPDLFFNSNEVAGFPIEPLLQSELLRKQYGPGTLDDGQGLFRLHAVPDDERRLHPALHAPARERAHEHPRRTCRRLLRRLPRRPRERRGGRPLPAVFQADVSVLIAVPRTVPCSGRAR